MLEFIFTAVFMKYLECFTIFYNICFYQCSKRWLVRLKTIPKVHVHAKKVAKSQCV